MKNLLAASLLTLLTGGALSTALAGQSATNKQPGVTESELHHKQWLHGADDCNSSTDPAIEVFQADPSSYILRQSKCTSFEAPFMYLLLGEEKALLLDTGATESEADFPLYQTAQRLIKKQRNGAADLELLVVHSHGHRDHHTGDSQFDSRPGVTLVQPDYATMTAFFGFEQWPAGEARIDLGSRTLIVIPTPGHQEESITVYDPQTRWLLTGDTLYPGYVYVKHWDAYKNSIARLADFVEANAVSVVLGAHIEMKKEAGKYYSIGTTYQPNEAPLALGAGNLAILDAALNDAGKATKLSFDGFIIAPMNPFQKLLSNMSRWITR